MSLEGSCAAISAACHPPKDEADTAVLGPVMWGETVVPLAWVMDHFDRDVERKGHCSFTSLDTTVPELTGLLDRPFAQLYDNRSSSGIRLVPTRTGMVFIVMRWIRRRRALYRH